MALKGVRLRMPMTLPAQATQWGVFLSICTVALFAATPVSLAGPAGPLSVPHTVALWHMDETSGHTMTDSSGNGHDGTFMDIRLGKPGFMGTAYSFNGTTSEDTVPDSPDFDVPAGGYKVSMYVNFTKTPQSVGEDRYDLIRKGLATELNYQVRISRTGKASCRFVGSTANVALPGSGPRLADGAWHQIVCWKTLNQLRLFVDGTIVASQTAQIGIVRNTEPVALGYTNDPNLPSDFYKGLMDEVEVVSY